MTLTIHLWHIAAAAVVALIGTGLYIGTRSPRSLGDIGPALTGAVLVGVGLVLAAGLLIGSCVR